MKFMNKKIVLGLVTIMLVGAGCGAAKDGSGSAGAALSAPNFGTTALETQRYKNNKFGFSFQLPSGWTMDETDASYPAIAKSPTTNSYKDINYRANIVVDRPTTEEPITDASLESLAQDLQKQTLAEAPNVTFGPLKKYLIGGKVAAGYTVNGMIGDFPVAQLIVLVQSSDPKVLYMLNGTTLQDNWNEYKDALEQSLYSFQP